ncbi:hypothetical protein ALC53_05062 [Atta colombica]|uniref:Uncharacterized protein n=1 Tax=Atta colombica TaxID=520822 RepID=A0A151I4H3_9HYME|nr:hypothetical protein ALC53_05062 [Atta colombica]
MFQKKEAERMRERGRETEGDVGAEDAISSGAPIPAHAAVAGGYQCSSLLWRAAPLFSPWIAEWLRRPYRWCSTIICD